MEWRCSASIIAASGQMFAQWTICHVSLIRINYELYRLSRDVDESFVDFHGPRYPWICTCGPYAFASVRLSCSTNGASLLYLTTSRSIRKHRKPTHIDIKPHPSLASSTSLPLSVHTESIPVSVRSVKKTTWLQASRTTWTLLNFFPLSLSQQVKKAHLNST